MNRKKFYSLSLLFGMLIGFSIEIFSPIMLLTTNSYSDQVSDNNNFSEYPLESNPSIGYGSVGSTFSTIGTSSISTSRMVFSSTINAERGYSVIDRENGKYYSFGVKQDNTVLPKSEITLDTFNTLQSKVITKDTNAKDMGIVNMVDYGTTEDLDNDINLVSGNGLTLSSVSINNELNRYAGFTNWHTPTLKGSVYGDPLYGDPYQCYIDYPTKEIISPTLSPSDFRTNIYPQYYVGSNLDEGATIVALNLADYFVPYAKYGFSSATDLTSYTPHIEKVLGDNSEESSVSEYNLATEMAFVILTDKYYPSGSMFFCDSPKDKQNSIGLTFTPSTMPQSTFTHAYFKIRAYSYSWGTWGGSMDYSRSLNVKFMKGSAILLTKTWSNNALWHGSYYDYTYDFSAEEYGQLSGLTSIIVSMDAKTTALSAYTRLAIDQVMFGYTTKQGFTSKGMLYFESGIEKSTDSTIGIDLSNPTRFSEFKASISSINLKVRAKFPLYATNNEKYITLAKPLADNLYRYVGTDYSGIETALASYTSTTDYYLDVDQTYTDSLNINKMVGLMFHNSKYSSQYLFGIYISSSQVIGDLTNSFCSLDYFNVAFTFKASISTSLGLNSVNQMWDITIPNQKYCGLSQTAIELDGIPRDWTLTSKYFDGNALTNTINSVNSGTTTKKYSISLGTLVWNQIHLYHSSPNYLTSQSLIYSREMIDNDFNVKKISFETDIFHRDSRAFLKANIEPTSSYISSQGIVSSQIIDKDLGYNVYTTNLATTNLREYNKSIDFSTITGLRLGSTYNVHHYYYSHSASPTETGYLLSESEVKIRNNIIQSPKYSFDSENVSYEFTTNAEKEYSAMVFMIDTKGQEFFSPMQEYIVDKLSNNINLSKVYVENQYIKGFNTAIHFPNPNMTLCFENLDISNPHNLIVDSVKVVPYNYPDCGKYVLENTTITETLNAGEIKNISVSFNFNNMNTIWQRGVYTIYVKFHEESQTPQEKVVNNILLMENDRLIFGNIYNYSIFSGLNGINVIKGNFTKVEESTSFVCYIMDIDGYGDSSSHNYHTYFYGNQYSPSVQIQSPMEEGMTFKTSYIQIASNVQDPNGDIAEVKIRLWNENYDTSYVDYTFSGGSYYVDTFNPFDLTTGRVNVDIIVRDNNYNYGFASTFFYCESYKEVSLDISNIKLGSVNIKNVANPVPAEITINYADIDPSLLIQKTLLFDIGSAYPDAKNYKIQRSPINIYYPQKDLSNGISDVGQFSYWKFNEYPTTDTISFELNAPIAVVELDNEKSTLSHKEYFVYLRRHLILRNYAHPHFYLEFAQSFSQMKIEVIDITGGENISITPHCNLQYGNVGRFNSFFVNFTTDYVIKNTDFAYKIIFESTLTEAQLEEQGKAVWIIVVGGLGGFAFGVIGRYIPTWFSKFNEKYPQYRKVSTKQIVIFGLIGSTIGVLITWFV